MQFSNRYRLLFSTTVLLFAACLRLWKIAEVPPGLHDDEAFFLLQAQLILQGKAFPIFIAAHGGNEPLFTYLSSLALAILGPVTWAGRLIAAWAGLLGVAVTIRVGNEMFPRRNVGALAGLILAGLFWHLTLSRYGIQSTIVAMAAAATMAALWYGVHTGEPCGYLLAGVCLGVGLYSYSAFRLFPLVPLCTGLALLLTERGRRRTLLASGLMTGGLALLIYAPLAWYFIQNPNLFFTRYNEATAAILGAPDAGSVLLNNAAQMVGGLFVRGDERWWHNIAFRPMLDSAQALFFMLGLLFCLRRWRRPDSWTLLAWLAVGLLPSILTERPPNFGRIIMVTPALALLMALGVQTAWEWSRSRLAHGLVVLAVGLSLGLTVRDLFGRWAYDPHLFWAFAIKDVWIGQALQATPTGSDLYTTPMHVEWFHDGFFTIEYVLGDEAYSRLRTFNGLACLVMPAFTSAPTTYAVVSPEDKNTLPALEAAFPGATRRTVNWHEGVSYLELYQIPAGQTAHIGPAIWREIDFRSLARMKGYTLLTDELKPGGQIELTVVWQTEETSPSAHRVFVHLIGPPKADGTIIYAQRDTEPCAGSYPTWQWHPGELIVETYSFSVPDNLPSGRYYIQTGWYADAGPRAGARLQAFDEVGQPLGDAVRLDTVDFHVP